MNHIDLLQWPAMLLTIVASWLVASQRELKRELAFWLFLASNLLWAAWGWYDKAHALIALQIALAAINVRGLRKNEATEKQSTNEN